MVGGVLAAPERFARETILTEALAWVVRTDHPLTQRNQSTWKLWSRCRMWLSPRACRA
jgi:DNA-binding transcriptional LysR family regulator